MWILKPTWVSHGEENVSILCVDIEPQMLRFATGAMDNTLIVWELKSVIERNPKDSQLALLSQHCGPVNCVRWSPSSQYFASGSDDKLVIVWEQGVGGLSENSEEWRGVLTLRGHAADVKELAWSHDGKILASGSIDNKIMIWDIAGKKIAPVQCLERHENYVSGLAFDPMDKFLVSLGDDKKIVYWDTEKWKPVNCFSLGLSHSASQPSKRFDFTADGLSVIVPGQKKSNYKYMASIYSRNKNEVEKFLVGHLQPVSIVKSSPVLYKSNTNPAWVVALGGYDCAISIWKNNEEKPVVIKDLFDCSVADISWSSDGDLLMACSSDGTVALICLEQQLGFALSHHEMAQYMFTLYGEIPPQPQGAPQTSVSHTPKKLEPKPLNQQIEMRTQSGKRRIQPVLLSTPQSSKPLPQVVPKPKPQHSILTSADAPEIPALEEELISPKLALKCQKPIVQKTPKNYTEGYCSAKFLEAMKFVETNCDLTIEGLVTEMENFKSVIKLKEGKQVLWTKYIEHTVSNVAGTESFVSVLCEEGFLYCYSLGGIQLIPEMYVGNPTFIETQGWFLCLVNTDCKILCWDIQNKIQTVESNLVFLTGNVQKLELVEEGTPYIETEKGEGFRYDLNLKAWVRVKSPNFLQELSTRVMAWNSNKYPRELLNVDSGTVYDISKSELEAQLVRLENLKYSEEYKYMLSKYVHVLCESKDTLTLYDLAYKLKDTEYLQGVKSILAQYQIWLKGINSS